VRDKDDPGHEDQVLSERLDSMAYCDLKLYRFGLEDQDTQGDWDFRDREAVVME
jgi:hypothetical protein